MRHIARRTSVKTLAFLVLPALCTLHSLTAHAADPRWEPASPGGGPVGALVQDPSNPRVWYAGAVGVVYRSLDGGATWQERSRPILVKGDAALIYDLGVDTANPARLFALTASESHGRVCLASRDAGATWFRLSAPVQIQTILAPGGSHDVLLAAGDGKLLRSFDGGAHWRRSLDGVLAIGERSRTSDQVIAMTFDYYAPPPGIAVWRSDDRGATWRKTAFVAASGTTFEGLVGDPRRAGTWFVLTGAHTYRTADDGATWSELAPRLERIATSPSGRLYGTIASPYTGRSLGAHWSDDGGLHWTPAPPDNYYASGSPADSIGTLVVNNTPREEVWLAGDRGLWHSTDRGASWTASANGIRSLDVTALATWAGSPSVVALTAASDVFASANQGATWKRLAGGLNLPNAYFPLTSDPGTEGVAYAVGTSRENFKTPSLVKTSDHGRHWQRLPFPYDDSEVCSSSQDAVDLDAVAVSAGAVYVAGGSFGHYCSSNQSFLLRSTDDYRTYQRLTPVTGTRALAIDARNPQHLFALTCSPHPLSRSVDGGHSWQPAGEGLSNPYSNCGAMALGTGDAPKLYVAVYFRGVVVSADGGAHFASISRGIENANVVALLPDPLHPGGLLAVATARFVFGDHYGPGGVFGWSPEAARWRPLAEGLPGDDLSGALAVDGADPAVLYAGTHSHGVYRLRRAAD